MSEDIDEYSRVIKRIKKQVERCYTGMIRLLDCMDTNFAEGRNAIKISSKDLNEIGELNAEIADSMKSLLSITQSMKEVSEELEGERRIIH